MTFAYVGTFTRSGRSVGVYVFHVAASDLTFTPVQSIALEDPSSLVASARHAVVYVACNVSHFEGAPGGGIVAFRVDRASGRLTRIGEARVAPHPSSITLDAPEERLLLACTLGGAVAVVTLGGDGAMASAVATVRHGSPLVPLGRDTRIVTGDAEATGRARATGWSAQLGRSETTSVPHMVLPDASGRVAFVPDMGLGRIFMYRMDLGVALTPHDPPWVPAVGKGPRHIALHPNGRIVYTTDQDGSTVSAYRYDAAAGTLEHGQTVSSVPGGRRSGNRPAELRVHPSGRYVYASNRGDESVAIFALDASGGLALHHTEPARGMTPRLALAPNARQLLVLNEETDSVVAFEIDLATGALHSPRVAVRVPAPTCIAFLET